jgi:hypothetical protein
MSNITINDLNDSKILDSAEMTGFIGGRSGLIPRPFIPKPSNPLIPYDTDVYTGKIIEEEIRSPYILF